MAEEKVVNELSMARVTALAMQKQMIQNWRMRSKKTSFDTPSSGSSNIMDHYGKYTKNYLVEMCMEYQGKHNFKCNGTKLELAKKIAPYVQVIETISPLEKLA